MKGTRGIAVMVMAALAVSGCALSKRTALPAVQVSESVDGLQWGFDPSGIDLAPVDCDESSAACQVYLDWYDRMIDPETRLQAAVAVMGLAAGRSGSFPIDAAVSAVSDSDDCGREAYEGIFRIANGAAEATRWGSAFAEALGSAVAAASIPNLRLSANENFIQGLAAGEVTNILIRGPVASGIAAVVNATVAFGVGQYFSEFAMELGFEWSLSCSADR